jgi:transposase
MDILALDLGKHKSVLCRLDTATGKETYGKVDTTPAAMHDLITKENPGRVVFEIGTPAGWLHDLCVTLGVRVDVVNPFDERWSWKKVKIKTDRTDAQKLAKLAQMDELPTVKIAPRDQRQHKKLIAYRHSLIQRRTEHQNLLRSTCEAEGILLPAGHKAWTQEGIEIIRSHARPMSQCKMTDFWRGIVHEELRALESESEQIKRTEKLLEKTARKDDQILRMQTIPGVGPRLAEAVVAVIGDPHRFASVKEVGAYAGLTPRLKESSTMSRMGRISKRGNSLLRTLLVEVAWISTRYNEEFKALREHFMHGSPTRSKMATVALARKLLTICWAMMRDKSVWDPQKLTRRAKAAVQEAADAASTALQNAAGMKAGQLALATG